jgi:hypothetical protein
MLNRIGRPWSAAKSGEPHRLSVAVTAEMKELLIRLAETSGRSISQEIEVMLERCLCYDRLIDAITTLAKSCGLPKPR